MWHCSYSDLNKHLRTDEGLVDYALAIAYIAEKNDRETKAVEEIQTKR